MKSDKHVDIYGESSEAIGIKTHLRGPMDLAKTSILRFHVGDLYLPERRNRSTNSRAKEEVDAQMCPCGKAVNSRTHGAGESDLSKKERDVVNEETR